MNPDDYVWNNLYEDYCKNCGEEEWKCNWYLYRQLEIAHWHYEDRFCQKHHIRDGDDRAVYRCYPLGTGSADFFAAFLQKFPSIAKRIGDLKEAKQARNIAMKEIERVGCIIYDASIDSFLLVKDAARHTYMFPRGKIFKSESKRACLVREMKEELGFSLDQCKVAVHCTVIPHFTGEHVTYYCMTGTLHGLSMKADTREVETYRWLTLRDLDKAKKGSLFCVKETLPFLRYFRETYGLRNSEKTRFSVLVQDDALPCYTVYRDRLKGDYMYRELKKKRAIVDDHENMATFGMKVGNQYTVDDFIRFNEEIENITIPSYDGNPNTFGDPEPSASQNSLSLLIKPTPFFAAPVDAKEPSCKFSFDYHRLRRLYLTCPFGVCWKTENSSIVFPEGNALVSDSKQI